MSVEARSPVEEALETQPFGPLQLRVVLLCALVQAFDGFDLGTIGMAAPSLSKAWGVAPPLFTTAFVMSSVGILFGALSSGPLGDRFGRKPLLIVSVGFIAVFSVLSALAWSIPSITAMRFLTGLGIGGAMPATVALTADYSPIQRRATLIMLMFCGNTLGGFLGGQLVAQILPIYGWQSIFLAGGVPPLLLIPILMFFLPESPRFLIAHHVDTPSAREILRRLNISAQMVASKLVDVARGNPVRQLFTGGLAVTTLLLWVSFFANLLNLYLFGYWMPTVLTLSGLKPETAVFYASMFQLGGVLSTLLLGPMIDRFGAPRVLACSFASGVIFILAIGLNTLPVPFIMIPIFGAGAAIIGSQLGANAMAAGLYPARIRSTGVGWALGIGRLGGIAGPAIGGALLAFGLPPKQIFLCACGPALIAACATLLLTVKAASRREVEAPA
ncbi:MAG TPA: MFS transporter [Bradyrhizobium sp.]|jgi:AAHS family 4-hydroxybenzoate transporter-like MFS transporter|uniref:MFS transporter n=1 Tax=Bradyrhizobium sp. TaxID=376 RepID=UPI002C0D1742|nr:MFS transporter [Bradyrhizobium sp.]HTB02656.1 MFS transporter [Bradyrhizobium sp.]